MIENEKLTTFSLSEHFVELKRRITYALLAFTICFIFSYNYSQELFEIMIKPLVDCLGADSNHKIIYTNLLEAFFTYLKISLYFAFILSLPIIILQIYIFMLPGLYKSEKKIVISYFIAIPIFFILGILFLYKFVLPVAVKFLLSFEKPNQSLPVLLEARMSEYFDLIMHLIIAFGLTFQLPVILTLLAKFEIISYKSLINKRKWAIIIIFIVAAVITPPDVMSQIALALPMMALYEISIIVCKFLYKKVENA